MAFIVTPTRDSTWIATQALSRIGASSVDNPPSPEDLTLAIDRLDAVAQNLQGRGVLYIADLDSVPSGIAHELANAVGLALQPDFGDNSPPGSGAIPSQVQIDANLRRITADMVAYGPQTVRFM